LGVNAGLNCLGQGNRANATLGSALRLVLQNIGGALPGQMDRATHGQPGKYTFCCAENEAANPWAPLHVERGFGADENVVTVVGAAGTLNLNSHSKDAADLLRAIALSLVYPTSNDYHFAGAPWVILSPEHAEVLKHGGLSKDDVKRGIWEQSKMEAGRFARKDYDRAKHTRERELGGFLRRNSRADITDAGGDRNPGGRWSRHAFRLRADVRSDARGIAQGEILRRGVNHVKRSARRLACWFTPAGGRLRLQKHAICEWLRT